MHTLVHFGESVKYFFVTVRQVIDNLKPFTPTGQVSIIRRDFPYAGFLNYNCN